MLVLSGTVLIAAVVASRSWLASFLGLGTGSPSAVVKEVYEIANQRKYAEVRKHLSSAALEMVNTPLFTRASGSLERYWDKTTREGTVDRIEILGEEMRTIESFLGPGLSGILSHPENTFAVVLTRLHFKDGSTEERAEAIEREGRAWKIHLTFQQRRGTSWEPMVLRKMRKI